MSPKCVNCMGAGIAGVALAFVLHCPSDVDWKKCPYLPPEQHTHQEVYIPESVPGINVVVTSSGIIVNHPGTVYSYPDENRTGNTIYVINVSNG